MDRDRSPSPDPTGPNAFSKAIRAARFHQRFRPPANIVKYTGDTNLGVWLVDYRRACQAGGANDDRFIIQYLPICLGENVRAWLEFLPADSIGSWADLRKVFISNFQGTYVRPGSSWDLKNYQQEPGESLRDYIRRFSMQCNSLPGVVDADVISVFLSGMPCKTLVH